MTIEEHIRYRLMRLLLFISALLGFLPKLIYNVLIVPSKIFRALAMLCIPKETKKQLVSHRLNKQRNWPCRCGSGKKFKNCHWRSDVKKVR